MEKLLTVFTPTYNRAYCLKNCYKSLIQQSSCNFIWQIIDDGSTDGTDELVKQFQNENFIQIEYIWKPNGGKASAINESLKYVSTPLWLCLDSDDILTTQAVEVICNNYREIKEQEKVCGLFAVRSNAKLEPMSGIDVPDSIDYATQGKIRYKLGVKPEYVQVYKSKIIKQYEFPMYEGEKFITESFVQDQIDKKYVFRVIHHPLMVCEYLEDGYTAHYTELIAKNPNSFMCFYYQRVKESPYFKQKVISAIVYNALSHEKDRLKGKKRYNLLICLTVIPGWFYYKKKLQPCLMYKDPVSGTQFVRGREKFQKLKGPLNFLSKFYKLFPISFRKKWFQDLRKKDSTIALGLRYALLKSLAKKCGDAVAVYSDAYIMHPENMEIGSNVTFQPMCYVEAMGGITIGDDVSIAHHATIISESHVYDDPNVPFKCQGMIRKPVVIGNDVWIGAKASVLCGVHIGDKAVIGANSVVNKDVASCHVVVGSPAKTVKIRGGDYVTLFVVKYNYSRELYDSLMPCSA